MQFAHGETVRVLRRGAGADAYGDPSGEWDEVASVEKCAVWPRMSEDAPGGFRDGQVVGLSVAMPAGVDVRGTDRLGIRGEVWMIDGEVADWSSPFTGWRPGVLVPVKRVAG